MKKNATFFALCLYQSVAGFVAKMKAKMKDKKTKQAQAEWLSKQPEFEKGAWLGKEVRVCQD